MIDGVKQNKQAVVSLNERRREHNQQVLQGNKPQEKRLQELEADLHRVIEQLLDLTDRMEKQESHLRQLIRALHQWVD